MTLGDYLPDAVFDVPTSSGEPPRAFVAPQRYVQGPGVIGRLGEFVQLVGPGRVALLVSPRTRVGRGVDAAAALERAGIESQFVEFAGECTLEAITAHVEALADSSIDAIVAMGGGKTVDTGKAVAHRLGVPVIVVPTLASNDAPCSALSVLYDGSGATAGVEFYPDSPALVVVDTEIVASAPERYLVAGIGDALATWYEARVVMANPAGRSSIGGRPTIAAAAIADACARTLFEHAADAVAAVRAGRVDHHLEEVVEANTLLSGLGFESGGLAVAHGVAQACSAVEVTHANHLHGEMVAFGLIVQLAMEDDVAEAERVAAFLCDVGLPVTLRQLSLEPDDAAALSLIAAGTIAFPTTINMPMVVTQELVLAAIAAADELGRRVVAESGDDSYRRLHNP